MVLPKLRKMLGLVKWVVVFRVRHPIRFILSYFRIRQSGLFDVSFYERERERRQSARSELDPVVHYLVFGVREGLSPHPLFDTAYYLMQNPDIADSGANPLIHYIEYGAHQGRNPTPLFDTAYYLRQYPDVVSAGLNPLAHYLKCGAYEDRKPNPLFDSVYYRNRYADVLETGVNPLVHYFEHGAREDRNPNPLFDTAYYLRKYPDVVAAGLNPLAHYLECGTNENRNPNPLFDTAYYLRKYPDVVESGLNPLVHYIECGARQNRKPNPLFDTAYYLRQYLDVAEAGLNPLTHYLECGACEDRNPNPLFDSAYYRNRYADVPETGMNPLVHFFEYGAHEDRNPNPLFDTAYYLKQYPDVVKSGLNPLTHYLEYGALDDGRRPHPLFDTAYYLRQYPDVVESGLNPLVHYLEQGALDGRKPNPLFDASYYLEMYPDVARAGINPLLHYLSFGAEEGRNPNPLFDTKFYLENNPEVVATSVNPLVHYLERGAEEGRDPGPNFDTAYYLETSPNVARLRLNPLGHYLEYGIREGLYPQNVYALWVRETRLTDADRKRILEHISSLSYRPMFSLIVPVYNTDERWLRRCLDSVLSQLYPDWELCIADDASSDPTARKVLDEYKAGDTRIRVVFRNENGHISASSNSALEMATGEFVALLDHDDELTEDSLYKNAVLLNEHPEADMIYSDEDKITEEGVRHSPFFKPDWSPDTFLSQMYTCHLGVYRTALVRRIGGFRVGFEGSQDYDLVLRLTGKTEKIYHIPKVLYHWRAVHGSTALAHESKNYAYKAGLKAIHEALDRRNEGGWVENVVNYPGQYLVHYPVVGRPLISIVIPTKDHPQALDQCLKSIFTKTLYDPFEVVVVDNGSVREETHHLFASWKDKESDRFRAIRLDIPFNFSRLVNEGVRQSCGALVVLLNDDVEILSEGWLEEMGGQAQRQSIGAVGAFLLYPNRTIQHAGLILGIVGPANHAHRYAREDSPGYFGRLLIVANYAAVTGACLMVKKPLFLEAGGLDEELAVAYNDVDFCLRLLTMGYRNVVLPQVRLFHHESRSRGSDKTGENRIRLSHETGIMKKRWAAMIQNDPYYNPNLTRQYENFTLGFFSVKR